MRNAVSEHNKAELLIRNSLPITIRNLGEENIGVLIGRMILRSILIRQSRFEEAESTLLEVIKRQRHLLAYRGYFHPGRLGAIFELAWCYRVQGKLDDSIQLSDGIIAGLQRISLKEHPLERKAKIQKQEMLWMLGMAGVDAERRIL